MFEPRGLDELMPDWKERGAPVASPVTEDSFSILTETKAFKIPNFLLPPQLVSEPMAALVGDVCRDVRTSW